jgi:all-trans-8'-apo-beta-carotenal 15,15'-oxygenase
MVAVDTDTRAWQLGLEPLEHEQLDEQELALEGLVPLDLDGRLFRVTPARFDVYGERYRHWFDGDGMVHSFRIERGRVFSRNRFVATNPLHFHGTWVSARQLATSGAGA